MDRMDAFMDNIQEFFYRMTDRKIFETRDVIRCENGTYVIGQPLTENCQKSIIKHLTENELIDFRLFLEHHWGEAL
jgi:pilus assembly protein CpaF